MDRALLASRMKCFFERCDGTTWLLRGLTHQCNAKAFRFKIAYQGTVRLGFGMGRAPSLCRQGVNLVQEDDGAPKLLSRPENLGKIAFRLAIPLTRHSLQRYIDQGHCCLARDDPAHNGRLQAVRICMNKAASDAAKAAQPP